MPIPLWAYPAAFGASFLLARVASSAGASSAPETVPPASGTNQSAMRQGGGSTTTDDGGDWSGFGGQFADFGESGVGTLPGLGGGAGGGIWDPWSDGPIPVVITDELGNPAPLPGPTVPEATTPPAPSPSPTPTTPPPTSSVPAGATHRYTLAAGTHKYYRVSGGVARLVGTFTTAGLAGYCKRLVVKNASGGTFTGVELLGGVHAGKVLHTATTSGLRISSL